MGSADKLKSDAVMEELKLYVATDAGKEVTKKIGLVYQIHIAPKKLGCDEKSFVVDLKNSEVREGIYDEGEPDVTFSLKDADFAKIAAGKLNARYIFMRGAMKIKGSLSAAERFIPSLSPHPLSRL